MGGAVNKMHMSDRMRPRLLAAGMRKRLLRAIAVAGSLLILSAQSVTRADVEAFDPLCISSHYMIFEINVQPPSEMLSPKQTALLRWYLTIADKGQLGHAPFFAIDTRLPQNPDETGPSAMLLMVSEKDCRTECRGTALYEDRDNIHHQAPFFYGPSLPIEFPTVVLTGASSPPELSPSDYIGFQYVFLDPDRVDLLIMTDVWRHVTPPDYDEMMHSPADFALARRRLIEKRAEELRNWPDFYTQCLKAHRSE